MSKTNRRIQKQKEDYAYGERFRRAFFGENLTDESTALHINWLLACQHGKEWLEEITGQTFA